ncbi:group II intron maturase-specific domain-containing protein [Rhodococcus rhodochrous]|uniref:group II intron maturase-specific domain-containing protein n=1 Tax=Rhodococcus rhodochrous TaxID=1829 RepID=UPI00345CAE2A
MAACCHSREQAEHVKAEIARWLAPRGLQRGQDAHRPPRRGIRLPRIQHLPLPSRQAAGKLLIKPSPAAVARIRKRLAEEMRRLRGTNARAVIARMNPTIRGWSAYYRGTVSSKVFSSLDNYMWQLTVGWARRTHPKKPKKWTARRHWGPVQQVQERSVGVWRRKVKPALDSYNLRLLAKQDGRCPLCGDHLLTADQPPQSPSEWERWWLGVVKRASAADYLTHHGRAARVGRDPPGTRPPVITASGLDYAGVQWIPQFPQRPRGLLEPYVGTTGTYGSEGDRRSNAAVLPDIPGGRAFPGSTGSDHCSTLLRRLC